MNWIWAAILPSIVLAMAIGIAIGWWAKILHLARKGQTAAHSMRCKACGHAHHAPCNYCPGDQS